MSFNGTDGRAPQRAPLDGLVRTGGRWLNRVLGLFEGQGVIGKVAASVLVVAGLAIGIAILIERDQSYKEQVEKWSIADRQFRSVGYLAAAGSYTDVLEVLQPAAGAVKHDDNENNDPSQTGHGPAPADEADDRALAEAIRLATVMRDLCAVLAKVDETLAQKTADAVTPLRELETLRRSLLGIDAESGDRPQVGIVAMQDEDGLPVGVSFLRTDRWSEVVADMTRRGEALGQTLSQASPVDEHAVVALDEIIRLLEQSGEDVTSLQEHSDTARLSLAYHREQATFLEVAKQAESTLTEADIAQARGLWQSLRERFATLADRNTDVWAGHQQRLQSLLGLNVQEGFGDPAARLPGRVDGSGPPTLRTSEYAILVPVTVEEPRESGRELVFVQYDDRCYAVGAATGEIRWIARSGYDARWLPQQFLIGDRDLVVLTWDRDPGTSLTVARSSDLQPIWSWHLPDGDSLAGPPYQRNGRLYVWLESGVLWQLDARDGTVEGTLKLPHRAAGPLAVRPDGDGAAVTDGQLAVYVIDFHDVPVLRDVVLPEPGENTLDARPVWVPPFLIVFENELTDRCRLVVLREIDDGTLSTARPSNTTDVEAARPASEGVETDDNRARRLTRFEVVHREELTGRLWQTPPVYGTSLLVASDLGSESVHRLQLQGGDPLFAVFRQPGRVRDWPQLPYTLTHSKSPFMAAIGPRVVRYEVNPLVATVKRQREVAWEYTFPNPETVPLQPLQATSAGVVAVGQAPDGQPALVVALDTETGDAVWTSRIGNHAVEVFAPDSNAPAIVRTATGMMLKITPDSPDQPRHLTRVAANDTVDYSGSRYSLGWVKKSPPEFRLVSPEGSLQKMIPLANPAAAPVSLFDDALIVEDSDSQRTVSGPWAALMDTQRQLHLVPLGPTTAAQYVQFSRDLPAAGWWRPVWLDGRGILLSHPAGHVSLFKPAQAGPIIFPREERSLRLTAGLATAPVWAKQLIWVAGEDSVLRAFTADPLEVYQSVKLSDRVSSQPAVASSAPILIAGLASGHVVIVDTREFKVLLETQVSNSAIDHVVLTPDETHILAFDTFGICTEISLAGDVLSQRELSGAVSAKPVWYGGALLVPTTAGNLTLIEPSQ